MSGDTDADVVWRPLTADDAPAIVRLDRSTLEVDDRDDPLSLDEVLEEFEPTWARPHERSIAAFGPDGELLAMAWIHLRPGSHRARVTFLLRPACRAGDVPARLLDEVLTRVRTIGRSGSLPRDATVEIQAQPHQADRVALLETNGFEPVRRFHELRRDLAQPPPRSSPPPGVTITRWAQRWSEPARQAHVEAFADHWGSTPPDEEAWHHDFLHVNFRPDLSFVAHRTGGGGGVHDELVVGYLLGHVWEQDWEVKGYRDAWIGTLGTRRSWRRRGVASALLLAALHRMRLAGMEYAMIGVDTESPTGADRLYAQLGFEPHRALVNYALPVATLL